MSNTLVNKEIKTLIKPLLQANDFSVFTSRNSWRFVEQRIEVLNFQSFSSYKASIIGCTTFSFSVNLGIYLTFIPSGGYVKSKNGRLLPEESQCHIRKELAKTIEQSELPRSDIWYVDENASNLNLVFSDALSVIESIGLSWFSNFRSNSEVLKYLNTEEDASSGIGNVGSPQRSFLLGYTASQTGDTDLAKDELSKAKQYECFDCLFDDIQKAIEELD